MRNEMRYLREKQQTKQHQNIPGASIHPGYTSPRKLIQQQPLVQKQQQQLRPSKNMTPASGQNGGTSNNLKIEEVLNFISTSMQTLSAFEKQLKMQFATRPIHSEMS